MTITALPTPPSRDDAANFAARGDAFLGALPTFVTEANALGAQVSTDAAAAAAAAATAVASPNTQGTSTTSLTIGAGAKTLTIQTGKTITASMWAAITSTADGSNWMAGPVTSYNSGTGQLILDVQEVGGSGTLASWTITGIAPMLSDAAPRALAAGSTVKDAGGTDRALGFLGSPPISITTSHTLSLADHGFTLEIGAGGSITVPLHSAVPLPSDFICLVRNMTSVAKSITPASGVTMHQSGTTNTGARNLKGYGEGSIKCTGTNDVVFCNGDLT
jgi:hypothetical protein